MGYFCYNEEEHRSDAKRDFNYYGSSGYDREYYDRYSDDECKRAYTEEFDRMMREEERRMEERREEERQIEEMQLRQERERDRMERIRQEEEELCYYKSQEEYHRRNIQEPSNDDELPF